MTASERAPSVQEVGEDGRVHGDLLGPERRRSDPRLAALDVQTERPRRRVDLATEVLAQPFENEPSIDQIIENMPIGSPERVAEQIVAEVRANRPAHYAVFAQYGGLPGERARRSLTGP